MVLRYELPAAGHVRLTLHDALGREVAVLVNDALPAGSHQENVATEEFAPGPYFALIRAGEARVVRPFTISR
jgi:hypothetical protein